MDPRKPRDEEEKDEQQQQQQQPPARPDEQQQRRTRPDADKPVFGRMGLDDQPDELHYRSITAAMPPPALGMGVISGRPLMHGGGLPGLNMGPPSFSTMGKKASPSGSKDAVASAASFGPRVDRTNYVNAIPRDLPPPPFRLEMHTHFHIKGEAIQRVCSVLGRKLCELDTDYVFKADKCKWKVEYRRNNHGLQRVTLNIIMFKSGKEYIVEVQRRDGDITALMHLYGELKAFFKRNQLLCEKDKATSAGVKRPAPKSLPKTPLTTANVRDAVSAIKGLLDSNYVDTQMQGVLGAISLSAEDESRSGMAALVPQLVVLGQSKNANVSKLVRVALARLCDHPECRQAFVESDGWQFIVQCAAGGANVHPEVQRESLHVVECLCPLYSDELAKVDGAGEVLALIQDWQSIEDPRLKKHACNAHRALKEAGAIA